MSPNPFVDWSQRLPNYFAAASADNSRLRARNSFEWAMIADGGLVITDEDWEVNKGLSSRSAIETMDIPALLVRVFHLKPRECFPAAPSFLRGVDGVSSGTAFPPLWCLCFFASRVYWRRGPDGSNPASAAEKWRLDITVRAELVVCVALLVQRRSRHLRAAILGPHPSLSRHWLIHRCEFANDFSQATCLSFNDKCGRKCVHAGHFK